MSSEVEDGWSRRAERPKNRDENANFTKLHCILNSKVQFVFEHSAQYSEREPFTRISTVAKGELRFHLVQFEVHRESRICNPKEVIQKPI